MRLEQREKGRREIGDVGRRQTWKGLAAHSEEI